MRGWCETVPCTRHEHVVQCWADVVRRVGGEAAAPPPPRDCFFWRGRRPPRLPCNVKVYISIALKKQYNAASHTRCPTTPASRAIAKWLRANDVSVYHVLRARVHHVVIAHTCDAALCDDGACCAVCLEPLGVRDFKLSCGHVFHTGCVMSQSRCPLCRRHLRQ